MAIIQPFKALRPRPDLAAKVASRPYDVLNSDEAREEVKDNPFSFLHITKAEVDLPADTDIHSQDVYDRAKENLHQNQEHGVLSVEEKPCYYIYTLVMNGRSQTGLVCVSAVEDYFNDVIKKHEFTRPEKEKDRIDHMRTIGAQTGNVFLAYNNVAELDQLIANWKEQHDPVYDFTAEDGIQHTIWTVNDQAAIDTITRLFAEKVPATYIADGHHRAASAAKVSQALPDSDKGDRKSTRLNSSHQIISYAVFCLKKKNSKEDFISALQEDFLVTLSDEQVKPSKLHEFGMYLDNQWYLLTAREGTYNDNDPIGVLDVTVLSENILDKVLDIKDQRTDKRIDFVGGIRGLSELEKRVNSGEMKVAFSLYPVTIHQLFDIADSGKVMPPKSTWFEPKLRDGLLTHLL